MPSYLYFPCGVRDPDLVKRIGEATALEVRATGISYTFAPCIAVSTFILFYCVCYTLDIG
jgi:hypothetical protein